MRIAQKQKEQKFKHYKKKSTYLVSFTSSLQLIIYFHVCIC